MKNIREAKTKVESALTEVTKITSIKDSNRLQIGNICDAREFLYSSTSGTTPGYICGLTHILLLHLKLVI